MDALERVRTSRERREAILDEFKRSGVSGAQFAKSQGSLHHPGVLGARTMQTRPKPSFLPFCSETNNTNGDFSTGIVNG